MTWPLADSDQDRIDAEASAWLIAIAENTLAPERERDFHAWLAISHRHAATFTELRATWDDLATLSNLAHLAPRASSASWPRFHRIPWKRLAVASLSAVAAAVIAFVAVPPALYHPLPRHETAVGEVRSIKLPDGSTVVLGAKSGIAVQFSAAERRVQIIGGEAYFDVVHNAERPFVVIAGDARVRDVGTKFNVNLASDSVRVSVTEGVVEIVRGTALTPRRLHAGQRTELLVTAPAPIDFRSVPQPIAVLSAPSPVAWREGRLIYDNVRLADLVADVNRYYSPGVTLATPAVGELRVTASFRTNEIPAFMDALSATLPARADHDGLGGYVLRDARP
jgi:transmembrane sensor